jgi:hypothetical protein
LRVAGMVELKEAVEKFGSRGLRDRESQAFCRLAEIMVEANVRPSIRRKSASIKLNVTFAQF